MREKKNPMNIEERRRQGNLQIQGEKEEEKFNVPECNRRKGRKVYNLLIQRDHNNVDLDI